MAGTATHANFTYMPDTGMLVAEDSDLTGKWNHLHGLVVDGIEWTIIHREVRDGDLLYWDLVPTTPVDGASKMRIYND
jgi:hypothetical protein